MSPRASVTSPRPGRPLRHLATFALAAAAALLLVACGDDSGDGAEGTPGGSVAQVPARGGLTWDARSMQESTDGAPFVPTILPTSIGVGEGRMLFALIDRDSGILVPDATITAHYYRLAADPEQQPGEYEDAGTREATPRVLDLRGVQGTSPAGAADLTTVYVTYPSFDAAGYWGVALDIAVGGQTYQPRMKFWVLETTPEVGIGQPAPRTEQLTLADVDSPAAVSSQASPNEAMIDQTVAEALDTGRPLVVAFVTPAFCQTRFCGPVMDAVVQPAWERYGDEVEFVHIEPYDLAKARTEGVLEPVPAIFEWGLRTEPFIFVIDADGVVRAKLEGVTDLDELSAAIEAVLG